MQKIIDLLNNKFIINRIVINNFTVINEDLSIEIDIKSEKHGYKKIFFSDVTRLDIDSNYYGCSSVSSIIIDDVTDLQWENIVYKVMISEDIMTFYCKNIELL